MILKDDLVQDIPTANGPMRTYFFRPAVENTQFPGIILYSEIFQMTGPIRRFATFLAGHGYLVAVPEVYHELEPAGTVLAYDQAGSDKGNYDKYAKELAAYDDDSRSLLHHNGYNARVQRAPGRGWHLPRRTSCLPRRDKS